MIFPMMERSLAWLFMQNYSLNILKPLNQLWVCNQIGWFQQAATQTTRSVLLILSVFFSANWTNVCLHHHSIKQHSGVSERLITSILVCTGWLIDSQGAGRLLRSQINWLYSQEFFVFFVFFNSLGLTQICCSSITEQQKSCTKPGSFLIPNHTRRRYENHYSGTGTRCRV